MGPNIGQYMRMKYGKQPEGKCECPKEQGGLDHVSIAKALGASEVVCGKCGKLVFSDDEDKTGGTQ